MLFCFKNAKLQNFKGEVKRIAGLPNAGYPGVAAFFANNFELSRSQFLLTCRF